jgi:hypothetical protein
VFFAVPPRALQNIPQFDRGPVFLAGKPKEHGHWFAVTKNQDGVLGTGCDVFAQSGFEPFLALPFSGLHLLPLLR